MAFGGGPLGPVPLGVQAETRLSRILVSTPPATAVFSADRRIGPSGGIELDACPISGRENRTETRLGGTVFDENGPSRDFAEIGFAWTRFGKAQIGSGILTGQELRWPASAARQASRQALRAVLTAQTDGRVALGDWEFGRGSNGAVQVVLPERGWEASVAYSGQHCVVVAAAGRRLGVDLEAVTDPLPDDLPAHLFSACETELLREAPEAFWSIWTLKEAFAKEIGSGLLDEADKLDTAAFARLAPGQVFGRHDGGGAMHGRVRLDGHLYAFAFSYGPPPVAHSPSPPG